MAIKLSLNELTSLLKRSLEGLAYCQSDFEDAANAIAWLESHGLKGLEIEILPARSAHGAETSATASESGESIAVFANNNVAFCGRMAVELACSIAAKDDFAEIEIQHCRERRAILSSLPVCAARGLHAITHWRDNNYLYIASINAFRKTPDIRYLPNSLDHTSDLNRLLFACASDAQVINSLSNELLSNSDCIDRHDSSESLKARYEDAITGGIYVDDEVVNTLNGYAENILVEATEQSRQGAGE